jgi:hypothetical protein
MAKKKEDVAVESQPREAATTEVTKVEAQPAKALKAEVVVKYRDHGWQAQQLIRIEPERRKLSAPFGWRIAEPLDTDASGQAPLYGCFDKIGRKKSERDCQIDLPSAALFPATNLGHRGYTA